MWVEIWTDAYDYGSYLLIIRELDDNTIEIYDIQEKIVIEKFENYEEALHWLYEDEYLLVEGRHYTNSEIERA
jgi:hypothetical protein